MTNSYKVITDRKAIQKLFFKRYFDLFKLNQTTVICQWPVYKKQDKSKIPLILDKNQSITKKPNNRKILDDLRFNLAKSKYYLEGLCAHDLRNLGFNIYGPIVSIGANKHPSNFITSIPSTIFDKFEFTPILFFWNGVLYTDYDLFNKVYAESELVYSRRFSVITKPILQNTSLFQQLTSYNINLIKNIINLCTRQR